MLEKCLDFSGESCEGAFFLNRNMTKKRNVRLIIGFLQIHRLLKYIHARLFKNKKVSSSVSLSLCGGSGGASTRARVVGLWKLCGLLGGVWAQLWGLSWQSGSVTFVYSCCLLQAREETASEGGRNEGMWCLLCSSRISDGDFASNWQQRRLNSLVVVVRNWFPQSESICCFALRYFLLLREWLLVSLECFLSFTIHLEYVFYCGKTEYEPNPDSFFFFTSFSKRNILRTILLLFFSIFYQWRCQKLP